MRNLKLVCFDLDDTLIREIHSVMLPYILNGKEKEHSLIQEQEEKGFIDYISAKVTAMILNWINPKAQNKKDDQLGQSRFSIPLRHIAYLQP